MNQGLNPAYMKDPTLGINISLLLQQGAWKRDNMPLRAVELYMVMPEE